MRFTIADVVSQFKREWTSYLAPESIKLLCWELGLKWRKRKLDPGTTFQLILLQALHGNPAISALPHLAGMRFSAAAFCKARLRLPLELFEKLTERITASLQHNDLCQGKWLAHRVFIGDGTGISMPETSSLVQAFGYPRARRDGTGFPVARLVFLMHFGTGMISKVLINPFRSNEGRECYRFHPELKPGDIFLGDRAFCSYAHICTLIALGAHALFRLHQKVIADFTPGRKHTPPSEAPSFLGQVKSKQLQILGKKDQIVEWYKSSKLSWMTREQHNALPDTLMLREVQYRVCPKGFRTSIITVVTTLLDDKKYPAKKIAELYFKRWTIETNINYLKTTMKLEILHSKSPDNIRKQVFALCIIYNLVRLVMIKAAHAQSVPPDRVSFSDALRWLLFADDDSTLPTLRIVPLRPGRSRPRIKKRHEKGFHYKFKTDREIKAEWKQQIEGLS